MGKGGTLGGGAFTEGGVLMISSNNGGAADSVTGTADNDTIFAGANDTVNVGAGRDEVYMVAADSNKRQEGAVLVFGGGGRTYVHDWQFGFDNDAGDNILNIDTAATIDTKEDTLLAYNTRDTVYFVDNDSATDRFNVLVGTPDDTARWTVLRSGRDVIISDADDIADKYYAAPDVNATLTFGADIGDLADTIKLDADNFINIHNLRLANDGSATIVGSGDKDVLSLTGDAAKDAHKHVSLGGGNDSIISGGTTTSVAGNTFYFGLNSDGTDVIDNFGFYQGAAADADKDAADVVILYNWGAASSINATAKNIELAVDANSKLNITGDNDTNNKIRYQLGYDAPEEIAQIGITSGKNNAFTYDEETTLYYGNVASNAPGDTLSVTAADENVGIWLSNDHGKVYQGIGVVDGSLATGTQLSLVGGVYSNTLMGGGEGTSSSLWGGNFGDNELIGGAGNDTFFFAKSTSNDTISGYDTATDRIRLTDVTLDDLLDANTFFDGDNIRIALKSESMGGSLTIKNAASGTRVEIADGAGDYRSYTATKSGNDWHWE